MRKIAMVTAAAMLLNGCMVVPLATTPAYPLLVPPLIDSIAKLSAAQMRLDAWREASGGQE